MKYLLPWSDCTNRFVHILEVYERVSFTDKAYNIYVWKINMHGEYVYSDGSRSYSLKEDAMEAADKHFSEKGYVLIPEDQVERFKLKLSLLL